MTSRDDFLLYTGGATFSRAQRVRLIGEVAEALLAGQMPKAEARLFLAGALQAWLRNGSRCGDLERVYLDVAAPRSSRLTAPVLWRRDSSSVGRTDDDFRGSIESSDDCETDLEGHDDD